MEDNNNNNSNDQKENLIISQNQFPNKAEIDNNNQPPNYIPPLININNNFQQAMLKNPPMVPIQYPIQQPQLIYQQYNIPTQIPQQNVNTLPQANAYPTPTNIYDNQSNIPINYIPNMPIPQSMEQEPIPPEVQQYMTPYTSENTQVEENPPEKRLNLEVSQNGKVEVNKDENCCVVCCSDCCDCFCDCLYTFFCCDCDCCKSQECKECCEGCLACLAVLGAICECIGAVCSIFAAFS